MTVAAAGWQVAAAAGGGGAAHSTLSLRKEGAGVRMGDTMLEVGRRGESGRVLGRGWGGVRIGGNGGVDGSGGEGRPRQRMWGVRGVASTWVQLRASRSRAWSPPTAVGTCAGAPRGRWLGAFGTGGGGKRRGNGLRAGRRGREYRGFT